MVDGYPPPFGSDDKDFCVERVLFPLLLFIDSQAIRTNLVSYFYPSLPFHSIPFTKPYKHINLISSHLHPQTHHQHLTSNCPTPGLRLRSSQSSNPTSTPSSKTSNPTSRILLLNSSCSGGSSLRNGNSTTTIAVLSSSRLSKCAITRTIHFGCSGA